MKNPRHTLQILLLLLIHFFGVSAQEPVEPIRIENPNADTIFYCGNPVAVAPDIIIENFDPQNPSDGIKISIVNNQSEEDILRYNGTDETGISVKWNATLGTLEITGLETADELQEAVRNVVYENTAGSPGTDFRSISISMMDADYLPETGHFYQYIESPDITWTEAKAAAEGMTYYDLAGYLATITSSVENDFIWTKTDGVGWIGASDIEKNHEWKWVTGPEADSLFWIGDFTGQPYEDSFSNWSEGEPNNDWGEGHYAHINQDSNKAAKSWNDLPNEGGAGIYRSQGFVVEYGTPADSLYKLSASAVIGVNQVPEYSIENFDTLVCGILQQQLNIQVAPGISTVLRSLDGNSIVYDSTSLSPTVEVTENGDYRFELEVFNIEQCSGADTITISFQNQPVAELNIDEATCVDYNLPLSFQGEIEAGAIFEWYSNDTLFASGDTLDSLVIPVGEGVSNRTVGLKVIEDGCADSIQIPVTVKPRVEIQADPPEGCTPLDVQFSYSTSEAIDEASWDIDPGRTSNAESPSFLFENESDEIVSFGAALRVVSAEGCESGDTVENIIRVHPLPTVDLSFEEAVCYEGNEEIWYRGNAGSRDTFLWDLSDIPMDDILRDPGLSEGPLQLNLTGSPVADIGLQVISEFGCKTDTLLKTFTRKPSIGIPTDTIGGCPPLEVAMSISTSDFTDQVEYLWDLGNGQTAGGNTVSQVYSGENRFFDVTVYGESSFTGCADTLVLPGKIFVYPVPEASFTANPTTVMVTDPQISFENTSSGASIYEWNFGDSSFGSTAENPQYRYENLGLFDVTLSAVNEFGCADTASAEVSVTFDKVFPPTAFSPNAASEEDRVFRIYAEGIVKDGYKLLIFNRWGEVVFTSQTPEEGWNGKMQNGFNAPAGTYFWVLEFRDLLGEEHLQNGSLTLLY